MVPVYLFVLATFWSSAFPTVAHFPSVHQKLRDTGVHPTGTLPSIPPICLHCYFMHQSFPIQCWEILWNGRQVVDIGTIRPLVFHICHTLLLTQDCFHCMIYFGSVVIVFKIAFNPSKDWFVIHKAFRNPSKLLCTCTCARAPPNVRKMSSAAERARRPTSQGNRRQTSKA